MFGASVKLDTTTAITVECVKLSTAARSLPHFAIRRGVTLSAICLNQIDWASQRFPASAFEASNGVAAISSRVQVQRSTKKARDISTSRRVPIR
jgi:hypothetical protein